VERRNPYYMYSDNRVEQEKTEAELSYGLQAAREETLICSALGTGEEKKQAAMILAR
jgi:hypothetical protein